MSHRQQISNDVLAIIALMGGVSAWQEQLEWGLKIAVSIVGLTAGLLALWQRLQAKRRPPPALD